MAPSLENDPVRIGWIRGDEYSINFVNDGKHVADCWADIASTTRKGLSTADFRIASQICTGNALNTYIQEQCVSFEGTQFIIPMRSILSLPTTLDRFLGGVETNARPHEADMSIVWSMVYYNIKLSVESLQKLTQTTNWLSKLRRALVICINCMDSCEDANELRLALPEILNPLLSLLDFCVKNLRKATTDTDFMRSKPQVDAKHEDCLEAINAMIKHLNETNSHSKVNQDSEFRFLSMKIEPDQDDATPFEIKMLPLERNDRFFGRADELAAINDHLGRETINSLLTYTIYGRRGIGKTHLALEYAYSNLGKFDVIFWIRCETSASLRQSFASAAAELGFPGAGDPGHFEENLVYVQRWLRTPKKKRWLLVFDNAEKERLLAGYWPLGARGSILITSRSHYNFMKDNKRHGETVPLFDLEESLNLLLKFLGPTWKQTHLVDPYEESDLAAARALMKKIGGLALAINQAATLIEGKDCSIREFLDLYMRKLETLPTRLIGKRDPLIHSLDTIWSIAFTDLSANARAFLGVLGFLAPDLIQMDLFLPRDQRSLQGKLDFCKVNVNGQEGIASLATVTEPSKGLQAVIDELSDAKLISVHEKPREFSIHRVIQEAMNYQNFDDLQDSFDAAVRLVYEAFPAQQAGDPLFDQWSTCELYVQHAVQLYTRFREYGTSNVHSEKALRASEEFIRLGANCGWYLYEIGDYDECLNMVRVARPASMDQNTVLVAHLRNTAASAWFDLNELKLCRAEFEEARRIREEKLEPNHKEIAVSLGNLGNLETAEEHYEEALSLLNQAAMIRAEIGDPAAIMLALTYLQIGRVETLTNDHAAALNMFQKSENLFNRQNGSREYMADLQFAYGNRQYAQEMYKEARDYFQKCLDLARKKRPLHPLVSAAYYKLGSCDYELNNYEKAKNSLSKALNIAEIRNPGRNDGTVARILWKLSQVYRDLHSVAEAEAMVNRALKIRMDIIGRTGAEDSYDDDKYDEMEHSYDILVSGFFR